MCCWHRVCWGRALVRSAALQQHTCAPRMRLQRGGGLLTPARPPLPPSSQVMSDPDLAGMMTNPKVGAAPGDRALRVCDCDAPLDGACLRTRPRCPRQAFAFAGSPVLTVIDLPALCCCRSWPPSPSAPKTRWPSSSTRTTQRWVLPPLVAILRALPALIALPPARRPLAAHPSGGFVYWSGSAEPQRKTGILARLAMLRPCCPPPVCAGAARV